MVSLLPTYLPATSSRPAARLIIHSPIDVAYSAVHNEIPKLLDSVQPDVVLHVGLAGGRKWYSAERSAPRIGFNHPDIHGAMWQKEMGMEAVPGLVSSTPSATKVNGLNGVIAAGSNQPGKDRTPDRLVTALDYDKAITYWKKTCEERGLKAEPRESDQVGAYMCGFIYYTTLAWFQRQQTKEEKTTEGMDTTGPVLFLHVPVCPTDEDVETGKEMTQALIEAMVHAF